MRPVEKDVIVSLRTSAPAPLVVHGRRVILRTLTEADYESWNEVRHRCRDWLVKWEPRPAGAPYPPEDRRNFANRCAVRERERQMGVGYSFGIFLGPRFIGEVSLSAVQRGPMQSAFIGYWIDEAAAGHGYTPEAVVALLQYCFETLMLHRIEINIIPRNQASLRVVQKIGLRHEGVALRYLEIDGVWEDHSHFAITAEEWAVRAPELVAAWLLPRD